MPRNKLRLTSRLGGKRFPFHRVEMLHQRFDNNCILSFAGSFGSLRQFTLQFLAHAKTGRYRSHVLSVTHLCCARRSFISVTRGGPIPPREFLATYFAAVQGFHETYRAVEFRARLDHLRKRRRKKFCQTWRG